MKKLILFIVIATSITSISNEEYDNWDEPDYSDEVAFKSPWKNSFVTNVFTEIRQLIAEDTFAVSGFSILNPLAALSVAASAETRRQLLCVINMENLDVIKRAFMYMHKLLSYNHGVKINIRNILFTPAELDPTFVEVCKSFFKTEIETDVKNLKDIGFSKESKNGFYSFINFTGEWKYQLKKGEMDFHANDEVFKVPCMESTGNMYKYAEDHNLNAQLLILPYSGKKAWMLIALPISKDDYLETIMHALSDDHQIFTKAARRMVNKKINLKIPTFTIKTDIDLKTPLKEMGITRIFDNWKAQLNKYIKGKEKLAIHEARQYVEIRVNEEGANMHTKQNYTNGQHSTRYLDELSKYQKQTDFIADRPFYFEVHLQDLVLINGKYSGNGGKGKTPKASIEKEDHHELLQRLRRGLYNI